MKYTISLSVFLFTAFAFMSFYSKPSDKGGMMSHSKNFEIPADVNKIIQRSCFGCHNSDSKNLKGKKKLEFDKLAHLKTYKLVGKLQDIADVLKDNKMPPKKFLARHPEKALRAEEKDLVANWASETAEEFTVIK
jgi:cytochrome c553